MWPQNYVVSICTSKWPSLQSPSPSKTYFLLSLAYQSTRMLTVLWIHIQSFLIYTLVEIVSLFLGHCWKCKNMRFDNTKVGKWPIQQRVLCNSPEGPQVAGEMQRRSAWSSRKANTRSCTKWPYVPGHAGGNSWKVALQRRTWES